MAERKQPEVAARQTVDDFKLVDGIGPVVEKRLHAAGILTYIQLAHMKPEKLANILDGMVGYSPKRIKEQDWNGQVLKFANQVGQPISDESHEGNNNSLHYASYTFELLLDRKNNVRRTRAMNVQSRQEATWAGWDIDRLRTFFVESGHLQITPDQERVVKEEISAQSQKSISETKPVIALKGATKIVKTRLFSQAGQPLGALIPRNTPFEVQLLLDLSLVEIPKGERLSYSTIIYMKKLGKSGRDITGRKDGTLSAARSAVIDVNNQPLAPGDYRLEALVALQPHSQPKRFKHQITAFNEGLLFRVF